MNSAPDSYARHRLLLVGLAAVMAGLWVCYYYAYRRAEPSLEQLIFENTFDRSAAELVVVQVERDGSIRGPDGGTYTVEEAVLLLPTWFAKREQPMLALYAPADAAYARLLPIVEKAREIGSGTIVLATPDQFPGRK